LLQGVLRGDGGRQERQQDPGEDHEQAQNDDGVAAQVVAQGRLSAGKWLGWLQLGNVWQLLLRYGVVRHGCD
jgi:hypothetical protein